MFLRFDLWDLFSQKSVIYKDTYKFYTIDQFYKEINDKK